MSNGNAIHTNHCSCLVMQGFIRVSFGEQLVDGVTPIPHSILFMPNEVVDSLIKTLTKARDDQREYERKQLAARKNG